MDMDTIGHALVINIRKFDNNGEREGSEIDFERVKETFKYLKLKVEDYEDLTKNQTKEKVKQFSEMLGQNCEQSVVCIMSHGSEGKLVASDGEEFDIEDDILDCFSNKNCRNMINKLKLFIFQGCRGPRMDSGVEAVTDASKTGQITVSETLRDAIIAFSTVQGYVAWRNPTEGAHYIQMMCAVFKDHAHEFNIQRLFNVLQKKLDKNYVGDQEFKITQEVKLRGCKEDFHFSSYRQENEQAEGGNAHNHQRNKMVREGSVNEQMTREKQETIEKRQGKMEIEKKEKEHTSGTQQREHDDRDDEENDENKGKDEGQTNREKQETKEKEKMEMEKKEQEGTREQEEQERKLKGQKEKEENKSKSMYTGIAIFIASVLVLIIAILMFRMNDGTENQTKIQELMRKIENIQIEKEEKVKSDKKAKDMLEQEKNDRMSQEEKRKEDDQQKEKFRIIEMKESLKEEFSHWITQDVSDMDFVIENMKNIKEFHRCKSIENIDKESFNDIVTNIAHILQLSDDRKEEIQLASKADTMVNVLEDFEHGETGFYSYGKYQTLKRADGNIDLVIALHSLTYEVVDKIYKSEEGKQTAVQLVNGKSVLSSIERTSFKSLFRGQAMRLFENDCPTKLLTAINIATQAEIRIKARDEKEKLRQEILNREYEELPNESESIERMEQAYNAKQTENREKLEREEKEKKEKKEEEKQKIEEMKRSQEIVKAKQNALKNEENEFFTIKVVGVMFLVVMFLAAIACHHAKQNALKKEEKFFTIKVVGVMFLVVMFWYFVL